MNTFGEALLYMLDKEHLAPQYPAKPPPLARFTESDNSVNVVARADVSSTYIKSEARSRPPSPTKAPTRASSPLKPSATREYSRPTSPVKAPAPASPNVDRGFVPRPIQRGASLPPAYASPVRGSTPQRSLPFPSSSNHHGIHFSEGLMEADDIALARDMEGKSIISSICRHH